MAARAGGGIRRRSRKFLEGLVDQLIAFAELEFRKSRKLADGASQAEHDDAAARIRSQLGGARKAAPADEGELPELPAGVEHLWRWFLDIIPGCESGWGPAVISWPTLGAWSDLVGIVPEPWEARALVRLGVERANILSEERRAENKG